MSPRFAHTLPIAILIIAGTADLVGQSARDAKEAPKDSRPAASRSAQAKGPLPDPALLDGSALEAEKRPEYGMLGEFEMPGDEKAKSERVGQSSQQPPGAG